MGIKTFIPFSVGHRQQPLKNLPTTWGLRHNNRNSIHQMIDSEKPPHHMGIKTKKIAICLTALHSEKPPHHMGIKTEQYNQGLFLLLL